MLTASTASGLGNHIYLLAGPDIVRANMWSWFGQILAVQAIGFGKIAVIAFLLRIQERTNKKKAWMLYFIAISNVIINIDQMILILLQCSPVTKVWDRLGPGTCNHVERTNHVGYFQGGKKSPSSSPNGITGTDAIKQAGQLLVICSWLSTRSLCFGILRFQGE